jgi:hypothetical protein
MTDRILGTVDGSNGYDGLTAIIKKWIADLGVNYDTIDELVLHPPRYLSKLLCRTPYAKSLGRGNLGPVLAVLGLKLAVIVDEDQLAKVRHKLTRTRWTDAHLAAHARRLALTREPLANPSRAQFRGNREWALAMHAKQMAATTPEFRRARASLAAKAGNEKRRRLREAAAEASATGAP